VRVVQQSLVVCEADHAGAVHDDVYAREGCPEILCGEVDRCVPDSGARVRGWRKGREGRAGKGEREREG
jgi:hypothetical protein